MWRWHQEVPHKQSRIRKGKALSEGCVAGHAFLNQRSDLIIGPGMCSILTSTQARHRAASCSLQWALAVRRREFTAARIVNNLFFAEKSTHEP